MYFDLGNGLLFIRIDLKCSAKTFSNIIIIFVDLILLWKAMNNLRITMFLFYIIPEICRITWYFSFNIFNVFRETFFDSDLSSWYFCKYVKLFLSFFMVFVFLFYFMTYDTFNLWKTQVKRCVNFSSFYYWYCIKHFRAWPKMDIARCYIFW